MGEHRTLPFTEFIDARVVTNKRERSSWARMRLGKVPYGLLAISAYPWRSENADTRSIARCPWGSLIGFIRSVMIGKLVIDRG